MSEYDYTEEQTTESTTTNDSEEESTNVDDYSKQSTQEEEEDDDYDDDDDDDSEEDDSANLDIKRIKQGLYYEKLPHWIKTIFPKELTDVLKDKVKNPKCRGRTTSINNDNVNDFAYYIKLKKKHSHIDYPLKRQKSVTPFDYTIKYKKHKCHAYICFKKNQKLKCPFTEMNPAPKWYQYLYILQNEPISAPIDALYQLIIECPKPIYIMKILIYHFKKRSCSKRLLKRKNIDKKRDINFYLNLSENDKDELMKFIEKRKLKFDIFEAIEKEGNFNRIASFLSCSELCEYVVRTKKYDEFKIYVDAHREIFKNMQNYEIILPRYLPLYKYAFAQTRFEINIRDKKFYNFMIDLIMHNCYDEVAFITNKGLLWSSSVAKAAFKTWNTKWFRMIPPKSIHFAMDSFYEENYEKFDALFQMGYYTSISLYKKLYQDMILTKGCIHFENLKYLDPNEPIDELKFTIANCHPKMIKEFISKFEYRFNDTSFDSWHLEKIESPYDYQKACTELGIDPRMYIKQLFEKTMDSLMFLTRENLRRMAFMCLKYPDTIKITNEEYLIYAYKKDDVKLAVALINCGADPDVYNWRKLCSIKMINTIKEII